MAESIRRPSITSPFSTTVQPQKKAEASNATVLSKPQPTQTAVEAPKPHTSTLYSKEDANLAKINGMWLVANGAMNLTPTPEIALASLIINCVKGWQTWFYMPKSNLLGLLSFPMTSFLGFVSPTFGKVCAAATMLGTTIKVAPKLIKSVSALKDEKVNAGEAITATAIHALNLGTEGYSTKLEFDFWNAEQDFHEFCTGPNGENDCPFDETYPHKRNAWSQDYVNRQNAGASRNSHSANPEPETCAPKSAAEFANMKTEELLNTPKLDPKCKADATIMMGLKETTCAAIKKAFHKLSLQTHPDRNKSIDPQAFINLSKAYETLNVANKC